MNENYYLLLDLDPSVQDGTVLEAAIENHRHLWSQAKSSGSPPARRRAEELLPLVEDMRTALLKEPARRAAMAKAAAQVLKDRKADLHRRLDELLGLKKPASVDARRLQQLLASLGPGLTAAELTALLKARGIPLAAPGSGHEGTRTRRKLEATRAEAIRGLLDAVDQASLYTFLGLKRNASLASLRDEARKVLREITRTGLRDPGTNARKELAGHCLVVFASGESREAYDNTFATQAMEGLRAKLNWLGQDKVLTRDMVDQVVAMGCALGVSHDLALDFVLAQARAQKWILLEATRSQSPPRKCGFCDRVAPSAEDTRCRDCGRELVQPCPACGQPTPTQDECCPKCGCSTGDRPLVERLLREGADLARRGDFNGAEACCDRVLRYWPDYPPALEGRREVQARRETLGAALAQLEGLVRANRLYAAQDALEPLERAFPSAAPPALQARIDQGLRLAQDAFRSAEALRGAGRGEDAVARYMEALGHCADLEPARRGLEAIPPPAPRVLSVTVGAAATRLAWEPVATRVPVTYRMVRKSTPPAGPGDGVAVGEVGGREGVDANMPPGVPWHYAVFTLRGGVASPGAARSGPHLRPGDPTGVQAEGGDARVSLTWTRPRGCTAVEVWREAGHPPVLAGSGTPVHASESSAVDPGLENGGTFGYLVIACYPDPGDPGKVIRSPGVKVLATPVVPPPAVSDLRVRREGRTVFLDWTPPQAGAVQLRVARRAPAHAPGRVVPLAELDQLGTLVPSQGLASTQLVLDGSGLYYFIPVSITARTAVLGTSVAMTTLDEVTDLASDRQGTTIHLTWTWPPGSREALVLWRDDAFPEGPRDSRGGRRTITREDYDRLGLCELRDAPRTRHYFTVLVREPGTGVHSDGARVLEAGGLEAEVEYRVVQRRGLLGLTARRTWIELTSRDGLAGLPALQAILKAGVVPLRPEDGRVVASLEGLAFRQGSARIDLQVGAAAGFVKLFFKDGRHARDIRLIPAGPDQLRIG